MLWGVLDVPLVERLQVCSGQSSDTVREICCMLCVRCEGSALSVVHDVTLWAFMRVVGLWLLVWFVVQGALLRTDDRCEGKHALLLWNKRDVYARCCLNLMGYGGYKGRWVAISRWALTVRVNDCCVAGLIFITGTQCAGDSGRSRRQPRQGPRRRAR